MIELLEIEKSRKKQIEGDLFVVQPIPNFYIYGRLIECYLVDTVDFAKGCHLAIFYKLKSVDEFLEVIPSLEDIDWLLPPTIVHPIGWRKGIFKTLSNIPLTEKEKDRKYPFINGNTKKVVDVHNKELNIINEYNNFLGIASKSLIEQRIMKQYNLNPNWFH